MTFWKSLELSQRGQWILGHVFFLQMAQLLEESRIFYNDYGGRLHSEEPLGQQRSLVVFWTSESARFF